MPKNKILVINCKTKKDYINLLDIFVEKSWNWASGAYPTSRKYYWKEYKESCCITFQKDFEISAKKYFKERSSDYKIITFTEFLKTQENENIVL
jgi:hypothetical protein